jgi:hypothetical protein
MAPSSTRSLRAIRTGPPEGSGGLSGGPVVPARLGAQARSMAFPGLSTVTGDDLQRPSIKPTFGLNPVAVLPES